MRSHIQSLAEFINTKNCHVFLVLVVEFPWNLRPGSHIVHSEGHILLNIIVQFEHEHFRDDEDHDEGDDTQANESANR